MQPKDSWVWTHDERRRVGRELKRRRNDLGLNQEQIATRAKISVGTVHNIEHHKKVGLERIVAYATVVGTTMQQLFPEAVATRKTGRVMDTFFSRTIDAVAEELAHDLLRDPTFRAEMQQLIRAAFQQALQELNAPPKEAEGKTP